MNNPFDFFSEIYCINLDHRTDRWQECQTEFESIGIKDKVQRFSAITHTDGRIGCIKSHLEILKIARNKNLNNVLILEDDVKFLNDPINSLIPVIEQIQKFKYSLLYLGANTHCKLFKIKPNLVELKQGFSTHAICYNKICYNRVIEGLENINRIDKLDDILDVWLSKNIQEKHLCLVTYPLMAIQRTGFSDIEKSNVNYSFIEERYKKNIE